MELISEAGIFGDLLDERRGTLQPLGSVIHFHAQQIAVGRAFIVAFEQATEIGVVEVAFSSDLFDRPKSLEMLTDMISASLVSLERKGFAARPRRLPG